MRFGPCLDSTISSLRQQLKVAPRGRLDIICLPLQPSLKVAAGRQNCGCSSVVERLVANEKVASSTLVTRSSPDKTKLRLAGRPSECTTLPSQVRVVFETAIT